MANPIIRGFRSLTRFSGRDRRSQFWPYAGVAVALTFVITGAANIWSMSGFWAETVQVSDGAEYGLMPDLTAFFAVMAASVVAYVGLLAAAVSRRLHDLGKSARWGLMPVPFLIFGIGGMALLMNGLTATSEPNLALFLLLFLNNAAYMVGLISLIVLLCLRGTAGPNRFGPEPA